MLSCWVKNSAKESRNFSKDYGRDLKVIFEPGKFLVSEAGFFFAKVNIIKQTTATVFAGLDTGFNHSDQAYVLRCLPPCS
jgi:diaminopimelate decarboxylase